MTCRHTRWFPVAVLAATLLAAPAFARGGGSSHGGARYGHGYGEPARDATIGHETGGEKARYEKAERSAEKAYDKVDTKGLTRAIQAPIRAQTGSSAHAADGAPKGSAK
jgi:hypothetical protein